MTNQEAIETIKVATTEVEWNYPLDYAVAFEKAIEALEKQIPKKPVLQKISRRLVKNGKVYECPRCRKLLCNEHHCTCGQALDWSAAE